MNKHDLIAELNAIANNDSHPLRADSDVAKAAHGAGHAIDFRISGTGDLPDRDAMAKPKYEVPGQGGPDRENKEE